MDKVEQLVKMANQIADNFSFHDDAVERIADHLQRFWAPAMRRQLVDLIEQGDSGLKPAARKAVEALN